MRRKDVEAKRSSRTMAMARESQVFSSTSRTFPRFRGLAGNSAYFLLLYQGKGMNFIERHTLFLKKNQTDKFVIRRSPYSGRTLMIVQLIYFTATNYCTIDTIKNSVYSYSNVESNRYIYSKVEILKVVWHRIFYRHFLCHRRPQCRLI